MSVKVSRNRNSCNTVAYRVSVLVLLVLLTALLGFGVYLKCQIMENNVAYSKMADRIIYNPSDEVAFSEDMSICVLKAPKGTGNYMSVFEGKEVWLVEELSIRESLFVIIWFILMDVVMYAYGVARVSQGRIKPWGIPVFVIPAILCSGVVVEYGVRVLFGVIGIGFYFIVVKLIALVFGLMKWRKLKRIQN